jgi:hypothetical protein
MTTIKVKMWCDRCGMYTEDNWELHEDRHEDMFYMMGLTNETLKQSLARLTILRKQTEDPAGDFSGASEDPEWGGR